MAGTKPFGIRLLCHQREPCALVGWVPCDTDNPRMCSLQLISKIFSKSLLLPQNDWAYFVSFLECVNHHALHTTRPPLPS